MPHHALIIGGGIGGLAAGVALRRVGWDVAVFEQAPAFREVGAGLTLWANAVRAMAALGLADQVKAIGVPSRDGVIRDWRGRVLTRLSAADLRRHTGEDTIAVHRAELVDLLHAAVGPAHVRLGVRCAAIEQDESRVTARFADGTSAAGDVLIGADGLRSAVRAHLLGDRPPRYAGYTAWRGVADFDLGETPPGETWGRGARFGLVPLAGSRVYWFATANAPEGARPADGDHRRDLLDRVRGWHDPVEAVVRATDPSAVLRNDVYDRDPVGRWGDGRITLLGDAAHPTTPNLGQGACQALEDAVELARCLRDAGGGGGNGGGVNPDVPTALRAYEARRIPRTARIVLGSRQLGRVGQWSHPAACWVRDRLVASTPAKVQLRQMAAVVNGWDPDR